MSVLTVFLEQDIESENVNVVKRLFKIQNINASTIRTVMVAHCRRHDNPDLVLDYEAQSQAQRQKNQLKQQQQPLLFDLGTSGSEEEDEEDEEEEEISHTEERYHNVTTPRHPNAGFSTLDHVLQVSWCNTRRCLSPCLILPFFFKKTLFCFYLIKNRQNVDTRELEIETQVAKMMGRARTKAPDSRLTEPCEDGEEEEKTYLLFTTGSLTYSPHQIGTVVSGPSGRRTSTHRQITPRVSLSLSGIKRIKPDQMTTCGPVLGEERSSEEFFDSLDHVIDIHGHIIGMGLSPDHRQDVSHRK